MWSTIKTNAYKAITPIVRMLNKTGITPNGITTIGLGITLVSTIVLIAGGEVGNRGDFRYVFWFGAITLFAGMFDMLDGQLARLTNKMTKFGALYDSVLDR